MHVLQARPRCIGWVWAREWVWARTHTKSHFRSCHIAAISISAPQGCKTMVKCSLSQCAHAIIVTLPCRLSNSLKRGLEETEGNQCTIITWQMLNVWFPQICDRLQVPFYRTKVTSWMASMEEEYRFIIMEADASEDPNWAQLCVEQVRHTTPAMQCKRLSNSSFSMLCPQATLCAVAP